MTKVLPASHGMAKRGIHVRRDKKAETEKSIQTGTQPTLLKFFGPGYIAPPVSRPAAVVSSPLVLQIGRVRVEHVKAKATQVKSKTRNSYSAKQKKKCLAFLELYDTVADALAAVHTAGYTKVSRCMLERW